MAGRSDSTRKTYRYLRVAIVALALLLAVSLAIEIGSGESQALESISASFYTPVRSVLVGALMGIGLALVAIQGRPGAEDTMLNLAGMLAPLVALVPAPTTASELVRCPDGVTRCIPSDLVPGIQNNVSALVAVGAAGVAFAWVNAWQEGPPDNRARLGLVVAMATWAGFAGWFWLAPSSFVAAAHYASAVPLFALIAGVAVVNARWARARVGVRGLTPSQYSGAYAVIGGAMVLVIGVAVVLFVVKSLAGVTPFQGWIFVVEAALLALFTVFWVLQTVENWEEGIPTTHESDGERPADFGENASLRPRA